MATEDARKLFVAGLPDSITEDALREIFEATGGKVTDVSLPLVSFRYTYRFPADGAVVTSDSTLRFRDRDEVETSLVANGYRVLEVRQAPDRPGREFVFVAENRSRP